jgi:large subunit ribosomal protein L4
MEVPVYNMTGDQVATFNIDEASLGGQINAPLIKQAYVMYHSNLRQGSSRQKTRSMVEGSTRKMYKQKGTGNARHGDKKVPQFRGGGRAFPARRTREDFRLDMPKKMRRKANRNALLAKLVDNEVRVIDRLDFAQPKTRAFSDLLSALKIDRTALVALAGDDSVESTRNAKLSARNIDDVTLCKADQLTCFEMLNHRYLIIEKSELEAWLAGPSSQTGKEAKTAPMGKGQGVREARKPRPDRGPKVKGEWSSSVSAGGKA